jgi:hypothetical protein
MVEYVIYYSYLYNNEFIEIFQEKKASIEARLDAVTCIKKGGLSRHFYYAWEILF